MHSARRQSSWRRPRRPISKSVELLDRPWRDERGAFVWGPEAPSLAVHDLVLRFGEAEEAVRLSPFPQRALRRAQSPQPHQPAPKERFLPPPFLNGAAHG